MTEKANSETAGKSGRHVAGYRWPRLGEKRKLRVHLAIDRLSPEVKEAIIEAREAGQTWKETAEASSLRAGKRLSPNTVQRWFDLRVEQPAREGNATDAALQRIIALLEDISAAVRS